LSTHNYILPDEVATLWRELRGRTIALSSVKDIARQHGWQYKKGSGRRPNRYLIDDVLDTARDYDKRTRASFQFS